MKAVHFGAGNIGRGFIGPVLSQSGYEVCFIARNKKKVDELKRRRQYPVVLANEDRDSFLVHNVTALSLGEDHAVAASIAEADIVTTAVGVSALKDISEAIAKGISLRLKKFPQAGPLHVMACENGIGASSLLKKWVGQHLRPSEAELAETRVAFPNTVVDRIVPVQKHRDPLRVMVEPFCEWVIDRSQLIGELPPIQGAKFADSLHPYVERKLFTVNTGHCCAAYYGYLEGYGTIHDAMRDPGIRSKVKGAMLETGRMLVAEHGFDAFKHELYIEQMLERFANPHFNDQILRVARSPLRKLSPDDRLISPTRKANEAGFKTEYLVSAIAAALLFDSSKDPEAVQLQALLRQKGVEQVVKDELGFPGDHALHRKIVASYHKHCLKYPHLAHSGFEAMVKNRLPLASNED
ncbi:mannitol-1-phosphate 5-dehydrogenase [Paenibacillus yonginensis]|uniref:Mannitol-1-phosphate 5-dehydrogenase n=1 Tax=Paenibacillus yonginensis TaxID=1462996 RepID=A0A1B1N2B6_9BACL|nr:mannitol-1-phosphate 5-dehydrogenase [Paenibacillus yonginensis]ANS75558.1 mannitol-1-phosphate 5-dehydrogenase [Paenibacillus yonginensis]